MCWTSFLCTSRTPGVLCSFERFFSIFKAWKTQNGLLLNWPRFIVWCVTDKNFTTVWACCDVFLLTFNEYPADRIFSSKKGMFVKRNVFYDWLTKLQKINQTSSSYSLLGSATVPLNNLVRSKSKSVDTEVNLVDGEQRATPVSTIL